MPRARGKRRNRAEADENARALRALSLFVGQRAGFQLGIVTYDTPATRDEYLDALELALADRPVHLTRLDLSRTPDERLLLDRLRRHLLEDPAPEGKRPAVMVVGLEATLDYRKLAPEAAEGMSMLRNANLHRDAFARLIPATVVLWLNPTASATLIREAPDLWHWRSGVFNLTGPPGGRRQLESTLLATPPIETGALGLPAKASRIAVLRDLIAESENAGEVEAPATASRLGLLYNELGLTYYMTGNSKEAARSFEAARARFLQAGDQRGRALAFMHLGMAHQDLGETDKAMDCYDQALADSRLLGDRRNEATVLNNLATVFTTKGQDIEALAAAERALDLARALGDRSIEAGALGNLALVRLSMNEDQRAADLLRERLKLGREMGELRGEATALGNLGLVHMRAGAYEAAIECFEQQADLSRRIGDPRGEGNALGNLGIAMDRLGQRERAIQLEEQSLRVARETGDHRGEAYALVTLANLYSDSGRLHEACGLLRQASKMGQEFGEPRIVNAATELLDSLRPKDEEHLAVP